MANNSRSPKRSMLWLAALGLLLFPGPVEARAARDRSAPHITSVRCWPPNACTPNPRIVSPGGRLRFKGRRLKPRMLVLFPRRRAGKAARVVTARLRRTSALLVTVPLSAKSGRIRVVGKNGRRSNAVGPIRIKPVVRRLQASATPLDGTGMWIWYVSRSTGGNPTAIVKQAVRYGVRTVLIKSSDGPRWWEQFSPGLVAALKAGGLRVCAWQFVYGVQPLAEADLGARAVATGADCLVIDAESQYEGRYAQAQSYISALRPRIGPDYPLGLAGFPYVDYHPAFPYSVFLGPGGAQYSLPQIYWKQIGTTVDFAFAHTYKWNQVYQRPIFPLGQLYGAPRPAEIQRFRQLASAYGAAGLSWWSWQSATPSGWDAIVAFLPPFSSPRPPNGYPELGARSRGDVVVWAQQHLLAAGAQRVRVNGVFDATTERGVRNFQSANGLLVTGRLDAATWPVLLRLEPAPVDWTRGARASRALQGDRNGPRSARLQALRDELDFGPAELR